MKPPKAKIVAGGWPCQDISIAGAQKGLAGHRSGLLTELLRVARSANAETIIAENVANLLRMNEGQEFRVALELFHEAGFPFISWRILNARSFGLPQHRTRLIIIASKNEQLAYSLFRKTPLLGSSVTAEAKKAKAAGFYWTAGIHSINYSKGYAPTLKIGSSVNIPSPPAIHYGKVVRTLSPSEALKLQGFEDFSHRYPSADIYRMAGNAVARPMGNWVFSGVVNNLLPESELQLNICEQLDIFDAGSDVRSQITGTNEEPTKQANPLAGIFRRSHLSAVAIPQSRHLACNLIDFIDRNDKRRLSPRAALGLLRRLERSGQVCPDELFIALQRRADAGN
jgi:site-specific DNA-cytosine methylase